MSDSGGALSPPPSVAPRKKYDHLLKLLLIGDSGVGKSCFLLRFADDSFTPAYITTIGIDFKIKNLSIDDRRVKLQVWDTAGQERFRTITTAYYRGAMGILLLYDVAEESSFDAVTEWVRQIEAHASPNVRKVLVANKCDVAEGERTVSEKRGRELAAKYDMPYFEASAKDNRNVSESFVRIARDILEDIKKGDDKNKDGEGKVSLGTGESPKAGCC